MLDKQLSGMGDGIRSVFEGGLFRHVPCFSRKVESLMNARPVVFVALCAASLLVLARATAPVAAQDKEDKINANLAKLSPEDRKIAEAQRWCAIEEENRLGAMGKPIKVMVKDEVVFVCCKSCVQAAQKDPDKTLEKVKELKAKAAQSPNK